MVIPGRVLTGAGLGFIFKIINNQGFYNPCLTHFIFNTILFEPDPKIMIQTNGNISSHNITYVIRLFNGYICSYFVIMQFGLKNRYQCLLIGAVFMLVHMSSMSACLMHEIPSGDSKKSIRLSALTGGSFSLIQIDCI